MVEDRGKVIRNVNFERQTGGGVLENVRERKGDPDVFKIGEAGDVIERYMLHCE